MSNVVAPFGFRPIGSPQGGVLPQPTLYTLKTGSTIYKGDPVIADPSGCVTVAAAGQTTTHVGIAGEYVSDSGSVGGKTIHVYDDPNMEFIVQVNTGVTVSSVTYVFNTGDIIAYAAPTSPATQSIMALNTLGTSHLPWMVMRLWNSPNNAWGDSAIVVVRYITHFRLGTLNTDI